MERLISHLQQTLDDDDAAKDALLLLRSGAEDSAQNENPPAGNIEQESDFEMEAERRILIEESSHLFILQSITSKILKDSVHPIDLPIKIAALHLDIPPKQIRAFCISQPFHTNWCQKFTVCFTQILDILEWLAKDGRVELSHLQINKLKYLREEMARIEQAPSGEGQLTPISHCMLSYVSFMCPLFYFIYSCSFHFEYHR